MVGGVGDLGECHRPVAAAYLEDAAGVIEIVLLTFENMSSNAPRLVQDLAGGVVDCRSRDRSRACAPGAVTERDLIGIAFEQANIIDRQPQAVSRDLAEGDVVPLPVRVTARKHGDLAVAVHAHDGTFPAAMQAAALGEVAARPGARLVDEGSEPDAHQYSFCA